jgi:hypothetical protein
MTSYRATELLPTITAFSQGKPIQRRDHSGGDWNDCVNPQWADDSDYRIKPDAIECWVVRDTDGSMVAFLEKTVAESYNEIHGGTIHHMREVL